MAACFSMLSSFMAKPEAICVRDTKDLSFKGTTPCCHSKVLICHSLNLWSLGSLPKYTPGLQNLLVFFLVIHQIKDEWRGGTFCCLQNLQQQLYWPAFLQVAKELEHLEVDMVPPSSLMHYPCHHWLQHLNTTWSSLLAMKTPPITMLHCSHIQDLAFSSIS